MYVFWKELSTFIMNRTWYTCYITNLVLWLKPWYTYNETNLIHLLWIKLGTRIINRIWYYDSNLVHILKRTWYTYYETNLVHLYESNLVHLLWIELGTFTINRTWYTHTIVLSLTQLPPTCRSFTLYNPALAYCRPTGYVKNKNSYV